MSIFQNCKNKFLFFIFIMSQELSYNNIRFICKKYDQQVADRDNNRQNNGFKIDKNEILKKTKIKFVSRMGWPVANTKTKKEKN